MVIILLELLAVVFVAVFLRLLITWPYELGVNIAVRRGAEDPSNEAFMLGWFFESIYIAALLALVVVERSRRLGRLYTKPLPLWGTFVGTIVVVTLSAWIWVSGNPRIRTLSPAEMAATAMCPTDETGYYGTPKVAMPNIIGDSAAYGNPKFLRFAKVNLVSANPKYKSVWEPKNWTVVSTDPAPGCSIGPDYPVTVYVTK